jgi:hypothetical protein
MPRVIGKRKSTVLGALLRDPVSTNVSRVDKASQSKGTNPEQSFGSGDFQFSFRKKRAIQTENDKDDRVDQKDTTIDAIISIIEPYIEKNSDIERSIVGPPATEVMASKGFARQVKSTILPNLRRRSSMALRGKRISKILGNGDQNENGLPSPHDSIPDAEYYRHISPDLPSPLRMKQLMLWGLEGLVKTRKASDSPISKILSQVYEQTIQSLLSNQLSLSWYNAQKSEANQVKNTDGSCVMLQNPRNQELAILLDHYKKFTLQAEQEIRLWENALDKSQAPVLSHDTQLELDNVQLDVESTLFLQKSEQFRKEKQRQASQAVHWMRLFPMHLAQLQRTCSMSTRHEQFTKRFSDSLFRRLNVLCFPPAMPSLFSSTSTPSLSEGSISVADHDPMLNILRALSTHASS